MRNTFLHFSETTDIKTIMNCEHAVEIFSLLTLFLGIASGKKCYAAEFSEDVLPCPDFENEKMKLSLKLGMAEGKSELGLNGEVVLNEPIEEGIEMAVDIWKETEVGEEFMYHMEDDICIKIKDRTTSWWPLIESMKIDECPVQKNTFSVKDMSVNLSHSEDLMTHSMCGEYKARMSMKDIKSVTELFSCYEISVIVSEYDC